MIKSYYKILDFSCNMNRIKKINLKLLTTKLNFNFSSDLYDKKLYNFRFFQYPVTDLLPQFSLSLFRVLNLKSLFLNHQSPPLKNRRPSRKPDLRSDPNSTPQTRSCPLSTGASYSFDSITFPFQVFLLIIKKIKNEENANWSVRLFGANNAIGVKQKQN